MSLKYFRHCTAALNDTTLLVFGGTVDNEGFEWRFTFSVASLESYTGYFLEFPDPLQPHNYTYTKVSS